MIVVLQSIVAFETSSMNYQTDALISDGGDNASSSNYKIDSVLGIISGNISSSNYKQTLGFFFCTPYTCASLRYTCGSWGDGCGGTINCGLCASGYTCSAGTCVATPTGGGSSGGGPSAGCTYDWVCSEWYPEPCPADGIQKRVCVNRGTCTGKIGMPAINRTCVPEFVPPAEPLFDIFAKIPLSRKWITPGESVKANIELINLGNTTMLDVFFRYWVVNENNTLITELRETRAVSKKDKFQVEIVLPSDINIGIYKFYAEINYDENKTAMAQDSFEVVESKFQDFIRDILSFPYFLLIILLIIFIIIILIKILKKKKMTITKVPEEKEKIKEQIIPEKKILIPSKKILNGKRLNLEKKLRKERVKELRKKIKKN